MSAEYPALGFDPLPGSSATVRDLATDTGIFASRLLEMAGGCRRHKPSMTLPGS